MLYTLSRAQYDKQELTTLLAQLQPTDALSQKSNRNRGNYLP